MAVGQDLFNMHFYSDLFASGHMSRIGKLRKDMPDKFGLWGGILINNMHNEENTLSVITTNPFQPEATILSDGSAPFVMYRENFSAYGDGTYEEKNNDETSNILINGMTNSLGDITRLMSNGIKPELTQFGGLAFPQRFPFGT
jgi:hypothetical protein